MAGQLIVPSRFANGKPNRKKVENPFARVIRNRKSRFQKRYVGKVWKDDGSVPIRPHPGRKYGATVGGWISDLVELRKVILLCFRCQPKFHYKRAKYYKDEVFPYHTGECDGCRRYVVQGKAYIPEESLSDPRNMLRPGQCWTPH